MIDLYPSDLIMSSLSYTKCSRKQKLMCKSMDELLRTRDVPIEIFALLPAQYAMCVSPVLCLHYCQCSVLCEDYDKAFVVFAQCTTTAVCHAGATINSLIILILLFFIIFTYSTSWEWMSTWSSITTAS